MTDIDARFVALQDRADGKIASAIERLLRDAPDVRINRINPLVFAQQNHFDETACIGAFVHATMLGLVDLSWNVTCAMCGGVLQSSSSLREIDDSHYHCAMCDADCQPVLDDRVEVTFTVSPQFRTIPAHTPDSLPLWDYVRQIYWSSGSALPEELQAHVADIALDAVELPAGASITHRLQLPEGTVIVFDPVSHSATVLHVSGPPGTDPQMLRVLIEDGGDNRHISGLAPGALDLTLENRTARRALPISWAATGALLDMVSRRVPVLSAKRLLSHQTFRDLFRTGVLDSDQRFRITNLTFLFTDLKGSTALYARVGDLTAYDLIRQHFQLLTDIIARHSGALVKTIGDAVMASFATPPDAVAAALEMNDAMAALNARAGGDDIRLKIGLHAGPCLAVMLNDRQDYFGQTVNIAARIQGVAEAGKIAMTGSIFDHAEVSALIGGHRLRTSHSRRELRGLEDAVDVCEIG